MSSVNDPYTSIYKLMRSKDASDLDVPVISNMEIREVEWIDPVVINKPDVRISGTKLDRGATPAHLASSVPSA
jgi:hypothetical protein